MEAWNEAQVFDGKGLVEGYIDTYSTHAFIGLLETHFKSHEPTHKVFSKILLLSIYRKMLNDSNGFILLTLGMENIDFMKKEVIRLMQELAPEVNAVMDCLPNCNSALGVLGNEDMQYVQRLMRAVRSSPGVHERYEEF